MPSWPEEPPTKPATPSFIRRRRRATLTRWALVVIALGLGVLAALVARLLIP
jgi:hypothetical protein